MASGNIANGNGYSEKVANSAKEPYALCVGSNEMGTVLAIGDSLGGLSLMRRAT